MSEQGAPHWRRIADNPKYRALVKERSRLGWTLATVMFAFYVAYLLLIAFDKALLAKPIFAGGVTSWGIPAGFGLIVFAILIVAFYVARANSRFDRLTREILEDAAQ
ncbi:hypothetical protein ASG17_04755 [Brevundimonas sp. Leaf363]|uniref:DUF485 domain-containing protein n=1 Tax=Brevundimonas sp. Leaf363 TaxID=1736353 RepID=UPI0006FD15A5|nr:DUF485 domain-containing protein [Brevundimonas sp. Leaf363]KQS55398.1 hypothetical protein ASG17_04755 [Brevundimonas sp. Leaf363]